MNLALLAIIVVVGVTVMVAAVHLSGGSKRATILSDDHARQLFASDFPDVPTKDVLITSDRETAFLPLEDNRLGIVHVIGVGFLTRNIGAGDVARLEPGPTGSLQIRLKDFTWRGGEFAFVKPDDASRLAAVISDSAATPLNAASHKLVADHV